MVSSSNSLRRMDRNLKRESRHILRSWSQWMLLNQALSTIVVRPDPWLKSANPYVPCPYACDGVFLLIAGNIESGQ